MLSMHSLSIVFGVLLCVPWAILAQTPTVCNDHFDSANATASVTVGGLYPQSTGNTVYTFSKYTVSTAVKQFIDEASKTVRTAQRFWLKSSPAIDASPHDVPFLGCAFILRPSPGSTLISDSQNTDEEAGCKDLITASCRDAMFHRLVAYVIDNVLDAPQQPIGGQSTCSVISSVLTNVPAECGDAKWDNIISLEPFGNPTFSTTCSSSIDIFNGSASTNFFYQDISPAVAIGNHTDYNKALKSTVPVIFTAWPKPGAGRASQVSFACLKPLKRA